MLAGDFILYISVHQVTTVTEIVIVTMWPTV